MSREPRPAAPPPRRHAATPPRRLATQPKDQPRPAPPPPPCCRAGAIGLVSGGWFGRLSSRWNLFEMEISSRCAQRRLAHARTRPHTHTHDMRMACSSPPESTAWIWGSACDGSRADGALAPRGLRCATKPLRARICAAGRESGKGGRRQHESPPYRAIPPPRSPCTFHRLNLFVFARLTRHRLTRLFCVFCMEGDGVCFTSPLFALHLQGLAVSLFGLGSSARGSGACERRPPPRPRKLHNP